MLIVSGIYHSINLVGASYEGINKGVGNLAENRPDDFLEHFAGKIIGKPELDLAGIFGQRPEMPKPFEPAKRAINQFDAHAQRYFLLVFGGEVGLDATIVDVQRSDRPACIPELNPSLAAPR